MFRVNLWCFLILCVLMPSAAFCYGVTFKNYSDATGTAFDDSHEYILNPANDVSLSLTAILTAGIGTYLYGNMSYPDERNKVHKEDLLPWDKPVAGRYSETADFMSDIGSLLAVAPLAIGGWAVHTGNSDKQEFWTFTLMFTQALLFQSGINLAFRSMELWPRPYIFATDKKGQKKAEEAKPEAYGSFFSGHASAAFTVAVFTSEWFDQTHPNSSATRIVRALAFSLAGFESALRVAAGKHYPTDVIVGALVGTGISYGILEMHKKRNQMYSLWVGPGTAGVSFRL